MIFVKIYHFLGSIYLAILLIALTAGYVAVGTFLEASSESHLFSASLTYQHPLFLTLIWGFFINILVSALRRWPFQIKHIPFLITHLGLLMLFGGVIVKSYWGIQGSMILLEGGSSNRLFFPHTHSIHLEKRDPIQPEKKISLDHLLDLHSNEKMKMGSLEIRLVDYAPHSLERKQSWIKGNHVIISGLKSFPVIPFQNQQFFSLGNKVHFHHEASTPWNILAVSTNDVGETAKHIFLQGLTAQISDSSTGEVLFKIPLLDALQTSIQIKGYKVTFFLHWPFTALNGLEQPSLSIDINQAKIEIALSGPDSLLNKNVTNPLLGKHPLTIDLFRDPLLLFVQDKEEDDYLFFFNAYGEIHSKVFQNEHLQSLMVYDDGFGGYTVPLTFPFDDLPRSRQDKEQTELHRLSTQLRQSLKNSPELAPPLALLKSGVDKSQEDFAEMMMHFLKSWHDSSQLLFDNVNSEKILSVLSLMDWSKVPQQEQYACSWLCLLLEDMEQEIQQGKKFLTILQEKKWPLLQQLEDVNEDDEHLMITLFAQQLFSIASQLPTPTILPQGMPAKALSAYLIAFGIRLDAIWKPETLPLRTQEIILETPLTLNQKKIPPLRKWEDNRSLITLELKEGNKKEYKTFSYDPQGTGFAWPILKGDYLLRYQPLFIEIPYRIRLHDARQINYPGTQQPFSYESDIIVTDLKDLTREEKTISMNQVYETKEGYRFYLASLSPSAETTAQRVQIVVNYDPAKYILTYPGALILSLGIILLFWMRPYKNMNT